MPLTPSCQEGLLRSENKAGLEAGGIQVADDAMSIPKAGACSGFTKTWMK